MLIVLVGFLETLGLRLVVRRFSAAANVDEHIILECALAAGADMIASGDSHLLDLSSWKGGSWKGIRILSPADVLGGD